VSSPFSGTEVRNSCSPAAWNLVTKNLDADQDKANRTKTVKSQALRILVSLAIACGLLDAEQTRAAAGPAKSAFVFDGVGYLHRWSMNHQHEFTPEGHEDLEKWSDMITINVYPDAHDGEALATKANAVLENYKSHNGKVLRTSSVPRTPRQPAEHFIAVVFGRPNFIEVAFGSLQTGGRPRMLDRLFTLHLRRKNWRSDERLAKKQRRGKGKGVDGMERDSFSSFIE
jgi:hypothetical protein